MKQLEAYYNENQDWIDEAWSIYCFCEGNFESGTGDSRRAYNSEDSFWEFVEDMMIKEEKAV